MQRRVVILLAGLVGSGCAADQRLTGLASGQATAAALIPVRVVSRCQFGSGVGYRPFFVIDGRVYVPGDTAAVSALDPGQIEALHVLKGEAAGALYGPVAAVAGVVVINTRGAPGLGRDLLPNDR